VDGEAVEQIAAPFERFTAGGEFESGQVDYGAIGSVFAGNPFRVVESESPGAAGIFSLAWKILRGAEVASTKMDTVGGVDDQLEREKRKRTQITPKNPESSFF